ncbi:carbohydrate ABC transporter permease [Agrobacterium fabrum]|uniref:Carbohydrate ABC transporter membrane protein 2, CUT1 family n=1 Tax=Agrobacterium fabrum TaxID=1176649 RepID=A0A3G2CZ82_9HYPH|nr:carbohydrate ABC transporter permease [Agrobacterium fabrum]AYM60732.1 multiple sugar transport system permease protein [Agrobacterium fabrum]AYM65797.1 multiple sugar transport system permease protein [Agrobacterium fabrum]MCR6727494.1 carbohydrate ABC transporter permease [Agrobacterium fabrum]WLP57613.1 carbohydrate ABC transporter permease [Agrobacterium fabrum]CUX55544.1 ABC transporter, membrane spanning protein (sugar) [Agrobacterium fabrum str. J-07]
MTLTLTSATTQPKKRRGRRIGLYVILFHITCILVGLLFLAPIVLVLLASFRPPAMASSGLFSVQGLGFGNYGRLEDFGAGILHYAGNSLFVALATAAFTILVSVFAGYGFSRFRFPFKLVAFVLILSTIMVPFQSILTPLFLILAKLGLQNTLSGLVFIYVTLQLPFSIFMMRNAFDAVPKEIEEAARIDGVKGLRALVYVLGPLVFPGIVSVGLFAFLNAWNEFLGALVLLTDQDRYTLPVLVTAVRSGRYGSIDWGAVQAGVTVMMIPCLILFVTLQRFYIRGLTAGAVK